ncbi:hypothetical protein GCM10027047_31330 [Rhodococcus aerolatus]
MTDVLTRPRHALGVAAPSPLLHRAAPGSRTRSRALDEPTGRAGATRAAGPVRDWRSWPGWTVLVAAGCALVVGVVHARGMYTAPIRFDDEGTYVAQARSIVTEGRLAPYTYWYDHPPLGWVLLAGWLAGPATLWSAPNLIGSGRQLMLVLDVVSVVLVVLLARRIGTPRLFAAAAGLLFGLSPLALTYHRMVLLDNIAVPLLLASFLLALSPGRRLSAALASGVLAASAVLVKETLLLMVPFVLWALWRSFPGPTRKMCLTVFGLGLALPTLVYPLFALTKGELLPGPDHVSLWEGVYFQLAGRQGSGSVLDPTTDAHAVVSGWLSIDPWLLVAAAALVLPALLLRRARPVAAALLLTLLFVLRPGYLPVPYVVAVVPLAALVVTAVPGAVVTGLLARVRRTPPGAVGALTHAVVPGLVLLAVLGGVVAGVRAAAPDWYYRDVSLMDTSFDRPYLDSTAWIEAKVPRGATLLVDNVTWTSLVEAGYPEDDLIWFTKPDADSAVDVRVPDYRAIDYVVASDIMRTSRQNGGTVQDALRNATPVASWGAGSNEVVVGKVQK